jgi:RHS repeat-associated protein
VARSSARTRETPSRGPIQFAGREYDTETQLYYDRARYLDPALGRFVSEDPIGLDGGINLYAFDGNDPVTGCDPSGTRKICGPFKVVEEEIGEHLAIGWELTAMANASGRFSGDPRGAGKRAFEATLAIGFVHELFDHDLTYAPGAPCNGLVDIAAFALVPFLAWQFGWVPLPLASIPVPPFPGGMLPPLQNWLPRPPWSQLLQLPPPGVPWPGIIL